MLMKKGREKGSVYYDQVFKERKMFNVSYRDSPYWVHWTQVIQMLGPNKAVKILDVGCGPGQLAQYLFDDGFISYAGFDFSSEAIDKAKKLSTTFNFFVGNAFDKSSYNGDYDVDLCLEVFEHLEEDKQVINNILEGKRVIFSVPNFWDPSHVRRFISFRQIKNRYYKILDIKRIVRVGNIYICDAVRSDFRPNVFQKFFKTREEVRFSSFERRIKSYISLLRDSL